ncbi:hypothetical protein BAUCODRAFT_31474 [Baudoinia panamericana UAMH 10762]|uniref:Amidase domain-containing protein n=1 Tax=Baudoinia panamericana (strain UAMH 10762) TaxID=717646 RepID=M2NIF0_BAUPA|nr:uncharacterized protein BAUCODRAFT_31474 [Baudoinia panamericana UAMH 10762]EMC99159.1 hypothetical protein BAUCODRAFT_31474 [Baudoinia panamericana UAMH 10762]
MTVSYANGGTDMATSQWINRPEPRAFDLTYQPPPEPKNPVVRGLALHYGAMLISSSSFIQNLLWANAGFDKLRNRPELEDIDPRYEPIVVQADGESNVQSLSDEEWSARRLSDSVYHSVLDYHEAYKAGKLTPTAVAKALLPLVRRDLKAATKHSTAFLLSNVDLVLAAAEESTKRYGEGRPLGPLDGIPVAVKDEEDVTGYRKCLGSKLDYTRKDNATSHCVQLWLDAGAVLLGKTNMHELGMDTTNNNPNYGTPVNPHNETYYCGGSSGGSAYTVSAGLMPVTMGNDGGGSVRIPSAYCGLYGLKPSQGRISIRPTMNLARSNGTPGPLAANMVDLEIAYRVMAQPDALDRDSKLFSPPQSAARLSKRTKVLGVFNEWFARADAPVKDACQATIDYLTSKHGYTVVPITLPLLHDAQVAHGMTILTEIGAGVPTSSISQLTAPNKVLLSCGTKTPSVDFLQAQKLRNLLMQHLAHLFDQHPGMIIVTPTTPNAGWHFSPQDLRYGCSDGNMQLRNMEYAYLANFVGCPAISVPVGYVAPVKGTKGRIPIGLQGMAEWCSEDELIAFGYDCERYLHDVYEGGRLRPANFVDVIQLAKQQAEQGDGAS